MLKFFRKYNKLIMAVGGSILMIAFLIPTSASLFQPKPEDEPIGSVNGRELTILDQRIANSELRIISSIHDYMRMLAPNDPLQYVLMLQEARKMGVSASSLEVAQLLQILGGEKFDINSLATQLQVKPEFIRQATRNWLVLQNYKEMVLGLGHLTVDERLAIINRVNSQATRFAQNFMQRGQPIPPFIANYINQMISTGVASSQGQMRVSRKLLERFIHDQRSNVKIAFVEVASDPLKEKVAKPSDETLKELFEKYKGKLKGADEQYGFGYKFPNRVKIEYLAIPFQRVVDSIQVPESEIVSHYDKNKELYTEVPPLPKDDKKEDKDAALPKPRQKTYDEVRDEIETELRREKARTTIEEMITRARGIIIDDARKVELGPDGYLNTERAMKGADGWEPISMREVADRLKEETGVLPDYRFNDKKWYDAQSLEGIEGIGTSAFELGQTGAPSYRRVPFGPYVMSARELNKDNKNNPLATQRLQAHLPSQPLVGSGDEARYLFRIVAADATREPIDLSEVREQVTRDATSMAAYEMLRNERDTWLKRARTEDFEALAKELKVSVMTPAEFARRQDSGGGLSVPDIVTIGRSEQFVDAVFKIAERVQDAGGIDKATKEQRIEVIEVDSKLNLYLVRLDEHSPITKNQFLSAASDQQMPYWISQALIEEAFSGDEPLASPIAPEIIGKRIQFLDPAGKPLKARDDEG